MHIGKRTWEVVHCQRDTSVAEIANNAQPSCRRCHVVEPKDGHVVPVGNCHRP